MKRLARGCVGRARGARTLEAVAWVGLGVTVALSSLPSRAADVPTQTPANLVARMVANEDAAAQHKDHYTYLSRERSDRTGGHLWSEKVVETNAGKVRMLVAEDGKPLTPERLAAERARLAAIAENPAAFQKKEQSLRNDEGHAKDMLSLLPKAFLFGDVREENGYLHIDFTPNPNYVTQSMEEHVLHGMSGSLLIDPQSVRLHHIEGRLAQDVSLGFGLLATIHAGSSFATTRDRLGEPDWKTTLLDTDIDGKAIFFKVLAKKQHAEHSDFVRVPNDMTVPQAVVLAER